MTSFIGFDVMWALASLVVLTTLISHTIASNEVPAAAIDREQDFLYSVCIALDSSKLHIKLLQRITKSSMLAFL